MSEIRGYKLLGELTAHNAGFCKWGFCEKNGKRYFIKEFLSPVYPADGKGISGKSLERKREICRDYFQNKSRFYSRLNNCRSGNNVLVHEFFLYETRFYIITDIVDSVGTSPELVAQLSADKKESLIRSLIYSVSMLHGAGIVHADLKPDNILLKRTSKGYLTAKIIDFDAGFFVKETPEEIHGDLQYFAPEVYLREKDKEVEISEKIDIFALGLLIHQYWCGKLPSVDSDYKYVFEAVLNGGNIYINDSIPENLRTLILRMLSLDPNARPSAQAIINAYVRLDEIRRIERKKMFQEMLEKANEGFLPRKDSAGFYIPSDL